MRHAVEAALATIVVPGAAVILVPYLILSSQDPTVSPGLDLASLLGALLAVSGAWMVVWVSYSFVAQGKGTPIPIDPPRNFVAHGLFRYVRNPMYVGALLALLGETILFRSPWLAVYALGLWLALHTFLVAFEEPQLRRRFGQTYSDYCASTPRWIPRRPRTHPSAGGAARPSPPRG